jgi:hypothetical protein
VRTVEGERVDHTWTEVTRKAGRGPGDAIIDPWCDGPAVLREDARYGNHEAKMVQQLDKDTGPEAAKKVEGIAARLEGDPQQKNLLNYYVGTGEFDFHSDGYRRLGAEFDPRPVFSQEFLRTAGETLHGKSGHAPLDGKAIPAHLAREIQAVGVALSLNEGAGPASSEGVHPATSGASGKIRNALAQAPGIIESAQRQFPPPAP